MGSTRRRFTDEYKSEAVQYVISSGQTPIPELKRVVVVHGGNVSVATSLTDAIALSFGQAPPTGGGGGQPTPGQSVQGNNLWYLLPDGTWAWGAAHYIDVTGREPRWC